MITINPLPKPFLTFLALVLLASNSLADEAKSATPEKPSEKPAEAESADTPQPPKTDPVIGNAEKAVEKGGFLSDKTMKGQIENPQPGSISLLTETTEELSSRAVAKLAHAAHLRVGWFYRCTKCDKWHLQLAGGYAIAPDVVVTAEHVLGLPQNLKEGWFIIADEDDKVYATDALLGFDKTSDTAIFRVNGGKFKALPLATEVEQGEAAYCYSDPLGHRGYFSDGIVNRFYFPKASSDPRSEIMNVSTSWAQGSSGSSIIDDRGNIIGHVARIQAFNSMRDNDGKSVPGTTLVLHHATPSKVILDIVKSINAAAAE